MRPRGNSRLPMEIFRQLEEKDELSRHKLRADRLLWRGKYHCAMEEYR